MAVQLPLRLSLREGSTFANFCAGRNQELIDSLLRVLSSPASRVFFIFGEAGTGKTHMLEAACQSVQKKGRSPAYVPLALAGDLDPGMLDGLETAHDLVCIDDMQHIVGKREWEEAVFRLHERMRPGSLLLVTGTSAPRHLGLALPDLATRLGAGLVYQLQPLRDEDKIEVLRRRAHARGLDLPQDSACYLLARHPRNMHALMALLERIDEQALAQRRALTIPFLRLFD